jgi:hypothetical protein
MATEYERVVDTFGTATDENRLDALRSEQVVNLPADGDVLIAGDIHDHRRNFDKLVRIADLSNNPNRRIILQELIHGEHFDTDGAEESWNILLRAAELKADFPNQVFFILANHDLAQIHGKGISKGSTNVCEAFNQGVQKAFGDHHGLVQAAITDFLFSFPLAIRLPNGIFCCHSLPTDEEILKFDYTVFNRPLLGADYARRTGPVYQLIWGRKTTPTGVSGFAKAVGAQLFITGHQPQESGYATNGKHHLIIASDHNQGVFCHLNPSITYDMKSLIHSIKKFVAVDV